MRHGETLFNVQGKIQGSSDSPLTKRGIEQAKIARTYFESQGITFDSAYSSTQERASDTLELITDQDYTRLKGIKEWDFGIYEGYPAALVPRDQMESYFVPFGGESQEDVISRVSQTLQMLVEEDDSESTLIVTHGIILKVIYELWKDYNQVPDYEGHFPNCVVLKYEFDEKNFSLVDIVAHDYSDLDDMVDQVLK